MTSHSGIPLCNKYEGICKKYEEICRKYEGIWRNISIYWIWHPHMGSGTWKNSKLFPHIGIGTWKILSFSPYTDSGPWRNSEVSPTPYRLWDLKFSELLFPYRLWDLKNSELLPPYRSSLSHIDGGGGGGGGRVYSRISNSAIYYDSLISNSTPRSQKFSWIWRHQHGEGV